MFDMFIKYVYIYICLLNSCALLQLQIFIHRVLFTHSIRLMSFNTDTSSAKDLVVTEKISKSLMHFLFVIICDYLLIIVKVYIEY